MIGCVITAYSLIERVCHLLHSNGDRPPDPTHRLIPPKILSVCACVRAFMRACVRKLVHSCVHSHSNEHMYV